MDCTATLIQDLRKAMKDNRFADMVFVCRDGEEVPALRKLVAARSPVLQSMLLTADMVESRQARVSLPSMCGPVMRICVEFFYTDTVQGINLWYLPLHQVLEVVAAARFFLVPGLEKLCIDFCVSREICSTTEVFKAYNVAAMLFHDQPHQSLAYLLCKLNAPIETALHETLYSYRDLSERGCLHFLMNQEPSHGQYHVLVHAIKWCAHMSTIFMSHPSVRNAGVRNVFEKLFPPVSEANLLAMLAEGKLLPMNAADDDLEYIKHLAGPLESLLKKASFDLSKIPCAILSCIFEPLDIIPFPMLLAAYKAQASFSKPRLQWDGWCLHNNYVISSADPSQISCTYRYACKGFARCSTCVMACDYLFFEWEVIFLEDCTDYCVGFCLANPYKGSATANPWRSPLVSKLGYAQETVALVSAKGCIYHNGNVVYEVKAVHDVFDGELRKGCDGAAVGVHIKLGTGLCAFKINGKKIGEAVIEGVDEGVYPAISMQGLGKACIRVVSHVPVF